MRPAARKRKPRRQASAGANLRVRAAILEAVENQLSADDPPEVRLTLKRLVEKGSSERAARLYIGVALLFEMNEILRTKEPFNEERYVASLKRLPQF
jgi:hypothetical protein